MDKILDYKDVLKITEENKSEYLYHFTSLDSLLKIIENKSFRLSRLDKLNDKKESELNNISSLEDTYVMSFSHSDIEYVPMWVMYGKKNDIKIRIRFNRADLESIAKKENLYSDSECKYNFSKISDDVIISDIIYFNKKNNIYRYNKIDIGVITGSEKETIKGIQKYDCWEFEDETRIRIITNQPGLTNHNVIKKFIGHEPSEEELKKYAIDKNNIDKDVEYVYLKITDELIKNMEIVLNPWISEGKKKEIETKISQITKNDIKIVDSQHVGEFSIGELIKEND